MAGESLLARLKSRIIVWAQRPAPLSRWARLHSGSMNDSGPESARLQLDNFDLLLRFLRYVGLIGFIGGLAALSAMWAFGPVPSTIEHWHFLIGQAKSIFFACSFTGIVILAVVGSISWWRHRKMLHRQRWFRLTIGLLAIAIPASHFGARLTAEKLYATVDAGELEHALMLWNRLGTFYTTATIVMLIIASIAIIKPRMGQA